MGSALSFPHGRDAQETKKQRLQREAQAEAVATTDLVWLMGTEQGRRIVRRLLDKSGVFRSSFDPNAMTMARAEGVKSYGMWLLEDIEENCTEQYLAMKREMRIDRDQSNRIRADDRNTNPRSSDA